MNAREIKLIIKIEEVMNKLIRIDTASLSKQTDSVFGKVVGSFLSGSVLPAAMPYPLFEMEKMKEMMNQMRSERKDIDFVNDHLRKRKYVRDDGSIHYSRFQNEAMITQSVWSRYETGAQARADHDTLLKIVLGLRLTQDEAYEYLAMAGSGFAMTDMVDRIVLSYIMLDYEGDVDTIDIVNTVCMLLDFYSEQEVKAGRKSLRKLYKL